MPILSTTCGRADAPKPSDCDTGGASHAFFSDFRANIRRASCIYSVGAMSVIVVEPTHSGRTHFTGLADHEAFAADARLQTERYEAVGLRSATRVSRVSASDCREFGECRFARRRIPVSPAHVTSALSLRELTKPGVTQRTPGFFFLPKAEDDNRCRRRAAKAWAGR